TYVLAGDGDLMEGITAEASSLAGHLRLGRLIVLYDNNHVSLSGATSITFTEDVAARYRAYGWHVDSVGDGNDLRDLERALRAAVERGRGAEGAWRERFQAYAGAFPDLARELERRFGGRLPERWSDHLPTFAPDAKGMATRKASEAVLQELAGAIPEIIGGS